MSDNCGNCGKHLPTINQCDCGHVTKLMSEEELMENPVGVKVSALLDWLNNTGAERIKIAGNSDAGIPFLVVMAIGGEADRLDPAIQKLMDEVPAFAVITPQGVVMNDTVVPPDEDKCASDRKQQCTICDCWVEAGAYEAHLSGHHDDDPESFRS